mmetsp:Transcript_3070/g.7250  ORF Transcript_3070/g.7250 Transcript_3070/m.7250 type:complete len:324 (+) Transcript_3070:224-1195(+)
MVSLFGFLIDTRVKGLLVFAVDLGADHDSDGNKSKVTLFTGSSLDEIGRWAQLVRNHAERIIVGLDLGLLSHQSEHVNRLAVKGGNGCLARLGVSSIASTRGGDPDHGSSLLELFEHATHGLHVLAGLVGLGIRIGVDMLLGVDANEVASHAKGNRQRIGGHLVAGNIDNLGGFLGVSGLFQQDGHDLGIGFRLVVGIENDILAVGSLFHGLGEVVLAHDDGFFRIHKVTKEIASPPVEIKLAADLFRNGVVPTQGVVGDTKLKDVFSQTVREGKLDARQNAIQSGSRLGVLDGVLFMGFLGGTNVFRAKVAGRAEQLWLGFL